MEKRSLKSARLKTAAYDPDTRVLEIEFHGGELRRFKNVPAEVWRRLLEAYLRAAKAEEGFDGSEFTSIVTSPRGPLPKSEIRALIDKVFG